MTPLLLVYLSLKELLEIPRRELVARGILGMVHDMSTEYVLALDDDFHGLLVSYGESFN